ncbi:unnamed protein product [Aphis gossypii]|uniref:Uncharacterized protein n=1 Tax=Aphis gossypii TaxID=80765 RepID=A0A9P0J9T1_APHGO|nr:unnamed protein product [Aphis gossypii]
MCETRGVRVRPVQFLQCRRWPQVRRALAITDSAPRRVPPVGGWDGARSLARAQSVPALRRRGTGPRQTPLGHRRRHGATMTMTIVMTMMTMMMIIIIIIRSSARRSGRLFFYLSHFSVFPAQGRSSHVPRARSQPVLRTTEVTTTSNII